MKLIKYVEKKTARESKKAKVCMCVRGSRKKLIVFSCFFFIVVGTVNDGKKYLMLVN